MENPACSTAGRHDRKSSGAKGNSADMSTGFRGRGQGGVEARDDAYKVRGWKDPNNCILRCNKLLLTAFRSPTLRAGS